MDVTLRQARHDETDALTRLAMASKQSNGYDDAFMAACADDLRVTAALLDAHDYWVAESGELCGFVCLEADLDGCTGTIGALFIAPRWQRRGIGRLLWSSVEGLARKRGLKRLRLDADPAAEEFYRSLGFATVGQVPSSAIPGRMLPHMQIDLSA